MRSASQRFPMAPYRALFTVTHRNESRTGRAKCVALKILILRRKSAFFFSDVIRVPAANFSQEAGAKVRTYVASTPSR